MDERQLSPGFRFQPTDVELVMYYLKRKLLGKKFHDDFIREVDVYEFSPWDLPDKSGLGNHDKWYFFCPRKTKYATGDRVHRNTKMGYWKSTGKRRGVSYNQRLVGTIRTLVFYNGRAPKGQRTDWVMHEYRIEYELDDKVVDQNAYVLCVVFKKNGPGPRKNEYEEPFQEDYWNFKDAGFEPSGSVSIEGDSVASYFFDSPPFPCSLLTDMSDTVTTANDPYLSMHEDDFSAMVDSVDSPILESEKDKIKDMEERERKSLINEILMGQGLARQLQNHLNSSSSSTENTQRMLVQSILDSYREVLSILSGQMEVRSKLHTSMSATPESEVDNLEFENEEIKTDGFERKKSMPKWTSKVRISPRVKLEAPFEDGYSWIKYGQKEILGAKYPRGYYRCSYRKLQGCLATKQVQRSDDDPMLFEVTYQGRHACNPHRNSPSDLLRPSSPLQFSQVSNTVEPHHCQKHDQQDELHPQELAFDFFTGQQRSSEDLLTHQEHCVTNPMIRSSFASGSSLACHVSDDRKEVVRCTKQDLDVSDAHTSLGSLQGQYLKKLINLLFDIYPSKSWMLNLRAECLVELNVTCRDGPQFQELVNLTHLNLSNSNFTTLSDLSRSDKLQSLNLKGCGNLVEVSSIQCLTKLEYLFMEGCTSLKSLPSVRAMKSLISVNLSGCTHLKRLPLSIGCLSSLTNLNLRNCKRIQNLPISTSRLKSLQGFNISGCSNLLKHMNNGGSQEMSSSVDPGLPDPLYSSSNNSNHQMDLSNSFSSDGMKDINSIDQQLEYSPSTSVSKVLSQEHASPLDPLIGEHSRQFEEDGNTYVSDSVRMPSHKRKTSCEMIQYQPMTSRPSPRSHDTDLTLAQPWLQQQQKGLLDYMSMPVEAIHEVDAFDDVERIVETLIQQSSDLHEISNLEEVLSYLGELQERIPDTLVRMHIAQSYRTSFQVKLAHLDVSLVQAEQEFGLLENKLAMLSEEEEKLDAEILCLMAKKEKLLNEKSSNDSI